MGHGMRTVAYTSCGIRMLYIEKDEENNIYGGSNDIHSTGLIHYRIVGSGHREELIISVMK